MIHKEFIGKKAKVVEAANKDLENIQGIIIDETKHLFVVETNVGIKKVPKKGSTFQIEMENKKFNINGDLLLASPEERIKFKVK